MRRCLAANPPMARHRKQPAPRSGNSGRHGPPAAPGMPGARFGSAMRRVVVTPTFAAGLGVVVAAVLAYPMQTVFSYVTPGSLGRGDLPCGQHGCEHRPGPSGKPAPFGVSGGVFKASPPAGARRGHHRAAAGSPAHRAGGAAMPPRLSYQITRKWRGGFWGQITITFPGTVPPDWRLRFGYPAGHIVVMSPGSELVRDGHAAVVQARDYPGGSGPGGRTFTVGAGVQGRPARPARCSFDGHACHLG